MNVTFPVSKITTEASVTDQRLREDISSLCQTLSGEENQKPTGKTDADVLDIYHAGYFNTVRIFRKDTA